MIGKRVVILGSGDIGLVMARRMAIEGAKVLAVFEIMPYSSGLKRNILQCLDDFNIPLYLNHTITKIEGEDRVTGVIAAQVDENRKPIVGTEMSFDCDTVLFSVGLIPENELSKNAGITLSENTRGAIVDQTRETDLEGVFACGNVLQVHDLVDFVSEEAELAGKYAARYVLDGYKKKKLVLVNSGENLSYVLPQRLDVMQKENVKLFFRVKKTMRNCRIQVTCNGVLLAERKKTIAVPSEMETILLPEKNFDKIIGSVIVNARGEA